MFVAPNLLAEVFHSVSKYKNRFIFILNQIGAYCVAQSGEYPLDINIGTVSGIHVNIQAVIPAHSGK